MLVDLRNCSARELIASLAPGSVDGVIADPPWAYDNGTTGGSGTSGVDTLYETTTVADIASILDSAYPLAVADAYLFVWCTWPKLVEWVAASASMRWRYVTGGAWNKSNGFGMGYHAAGDSEFWLIYVKGSPRPAEGRQSNAVSARRAAHSEKPAEALDRMLRTTCPAGGTVLDPFAGETASLARACIRLGRNYIGAELDAERHARAMGRIDPEWARRVPDSAALAGQPSLFGPRP